MQNSQQRILTPPSLPSGGGAISGLKGDIAATGPDGAATLSLPLPVSAGRGYAPSLALSYHSRSGNGPFGIGWSLNLSAVRRRTAKGVPAYNGEDEFTGPDGEVLVPVLADGGKPETRSASTLLGISLKGKFTVHTYRSRTETSISRFEYWLPDVADETDFWVMYSPDGQVHLLGRTYPARICNPDNNAQTAVWLAESCVSQNGEQIYWQYRAEDEAGCDEGEKSAHPAATSQRYPVAVWYGNRRASRTLPALLSEPAAGDWLFTLVMDYGERDTGLAISPGWLAPGSGNWPCRQDVFSGWEYGFEVRTRRLCRQVLMYHAVRALDGEETGGDEPELVSRFLIEYDASSSVSTLKTVHQAAYEPDGTLCTLPPLAFGWQEFTPPAAGEVNWQRREDMGGLNLQQAYQMVDLNGEGMAGILYQDSGAWWYRAPVRQAGDNPDAITWDKAAPLPAIPALREGGVLIDLNGDGLLEWVVTAPGLAGKYDRTPEREWCRFTPLSALPVEYAHPRALLTDLTGAGLADLTLIGPKSVRFYSGDGGGWEKARTVIQAEGVNLPVPGTDARVMVSFSDMAGSGQQHLVEVRADGVCYWPNLGHGRFGRPVSMSGFSQPATTFDPDLLYLADIDGSGTTDLIYVQTGRLEIYLNQSGNRFAAPFRVNLPDGVHYDRTCSLQLADIQGLGTASLVLMVPHPVPQHWVCHLSVNKPWLLNAMNNSMAAVHRLYYRSSAQLWLDEKAAAAAEGKPVPVCYLPFALHTLQRTETADEITGNRLVSTVLYRHGTWDGQEREFRGFGFIEVTDTDMLSQGTAKEVSMPAISRSWYATGLPVVDASLPEEYWKGDMAAFSGFIPRFTTGYAEDEQVFVPDDTAAFWLNRGVKGTLLRNELYGADGSGQADIPYTVTENRPQIRLVQGAGAYPVVLPGVVESRTYTYERVSTDPQCVQQVLLSGNEHGLPLRQVSISYPRRNPLAESPYPDALPDTLYAASFDDQQQSLRLMLQQNSWHTLSDSAVGIWLPGLADATRGDAFICPADTVPAEGLSLEWLLANDSLTAGEHSGTFTGQQQVWYLDDDGNDTTGTPAFPPLQAFIETAVLDEDAVTLLREEISPEKLEKKAGYSQTGYLFSRKDETTRTLWAVRQGHRMYGTAEHFRLPVAFRETMLTGEVSVTWDAHDCVITQLRDASGLTTTAEYDWRSLAPVRITDGNDNVHACAFDALGRVTSRRFSGTENGRPTGYSGEDMTLPETAVSALALSAPLPVAVCHVYVADSWQREDGNKLPPHVVTLTTDRYDSDPAQQIRQQVTFCDGFGRVLQSATRQVAGEAWQRADDGSLVTGPDGLPAEAEATSRWAVTGRTEYDNKGLPVRTFQPYFLNSWKYVSDDSARQDLYADTHNYDPAGREWQVKTAKGLLRRTLFTPWFVVSEDENNTTA